MLENDNNSTTRLPLRTTTRGKVFLVAGYRRSRRVAVLTTYERGLQLELALKKLFESKGYRVTHNLKTRGRSGTEHQIDLLLEYDEPLQTSRTLVEAKAYEKPVDKDRVMKLIQIVEDVGADRGIIVTTSRFTLGAVSIARGRNIDIWDCEHLARVLGEVQLSALAGQPAAQFVPSVSVMPPVLSREAAQKIGQGQAERLAKGGFLGAGKVFETLEKTELILYPFYEVTASVTVIRVEKTGVLSKREVSKQMPATVSFDGISGEPVSPTDKGIDFPFSRLSMLTEEEIRVLRRMPSSFTLHAIVGLGYSPYKARNIVSGLSGKGVLQPVRRGGTVYYRLTVAFPSDPTVLASISSRNKPQERLPDEVTTVPPKIEAGAVAKAAENYWGGSVDSVATVYYPFFLLQYRKDDGSLRHEFLDAVTGNVNETMTRTRSLQKTKE